MQHINRAVVALVDLVPSGAVAVFGSLADRCRVRRPWFADLQKSAQHFTVFKIFAFVLFDKLKGREYNCILCL